MVTSDLHLPLNIKQFYESLKDIEDVDYILLAGDIVDRNQHIYFKKLYDILKNKFKDAEIYSVFGNNESIEYREIYKKEYFFMNWLDYSYVDLGKYYLFGFPGLPDRFWKRTIEDLKEEAKNRIKNVLDKIKDKDVIVLTHYGVIKETVLGDPGPEWSLYSKDIGNLILSYENVRYIFHGHSHLSKNWKYKIGNKEIYNVCFYIHKKPLVFDL